MRYYISDTRKILMLTVYVPFQAYNTTLFVSLQIAVFIAQSEVVGLIVNFFSIESPTSDETNLAYLYASIPILLSLLSDIP